MIDTIFQLLIHYKYYLLIPLAFLEGPLAMMMSGFLIKLDIFAIIPAFIFLVLGDMLGDVFWYTIGFWVGKPFINKFGIYFSITEDKVRVIERVFHKHKDPIILISKVTMGLGFALVTLIVAGMVKIPLKRFLWLNFIGQIVWTTILMIVGYVFGTLYITINDQLGRISIIGLFILIVAALLGFGNYIRKRVTSSYS